MSTDTIREPYVELRKVSIDFPLHMNEHQHGGDVDKRYFNGCIMEKNVRGYPSIIMWGGIALNQKVGPGRGYVETVSRNIGY